MYIVDIRIFVRCRELLFNNISKKKRLYILELKNVNKISLTIFTVLVITKLHLKIR